MQTFPDVFQCGEKRLERYLLQAARNYLCFSAKRFGCFDIEDPIPDGDPEYDAPNTGLKLLFSAWDHDPGFDATRPERDTVADGNAKNSARQR